MVKTTAKTTTTTAHTDHYDQRSFFTRWFMSTNHKDIGILYLFTSAFVGFVSICFTVYMRLELMDPGVQYMCLENLDRVANAAAIAAGDCTPNGHLWNVLITAHGILMMFFVVIPALFGGFGNYFMPLMIGAPDMAFPRLNNLSYWMYVTGSILAVLSVITPGGNSQAGSGVGWVLYAPLSTREGGVSMDFAIFAVHVSGASSILGAINMITTFLNMRAPGMTLHKTPLFAWSIFVTALLILLSLPVLAGAITMLLTDRNFGTTFFDAAGGGRSYFIPTPAVVLWPSRGLYDNSPWLRYYQPRDCHLFKEADFRLFADGLCYGSHWSAGLCRLGASHVHGRHVAESAKVFHAGNDGDCRANWGENLFVDCDYVGWLCRVKNPDVMGIRVFVFIHGRRGYGHSSVASGD